MPCRYPGHVTKYGCRTERIGAGKPARYRSKCGALCGSHSRRSSSLALLAVTNPIISAAGASNAHQFQVALGDLPTWALFVGAFAAALIALRQLRIQQEDSASRTQQLERQQANDVDTTWRRADDVAGWSEPGESPEDTIIREVKEEASLAVRIGQRLGERVHPVTGKRMIYFAAWPTHGTDIHVGDEAELAEVRWVSLAEAEELLPGMFEPVHEYLARVMGEGEE